MWSYQPLVFYSLGMGAGQLRAKCNPSAQVYASPANPGACNAARLLAQNLDVEGDPYAEVTVD